MIKRDLDMLMIFAPGGEVKNTHFGYHLGSAYIIAYLNKNGFKTSQFVSNNTNNVNECVKKIMNLKPPVSVITKGGELEIFETRGEMFLSGSAREIYKGTYIIPDNFITTTYR